MKKVNIGSRLEASALVMGCWRYGELDTPDVTALTQTAIEGGIDFF